MADLSRSHRHHGRHAPWLSREATFAYEIVRAKNCHDRFLASFCAIARLDKSAIIRLIREEPAFSEMFMAHLLARTIRIEEDLVDQLFNSSEKRLARVLLLLANFGKEGKPEPVIARISQEMLAEMVGTTRARVSFS